jgi:hypothetical protein
MATYYFKSEDREAMLQAMQDAAFGIQEVLLDEVGNSIHRFVPTEGYTINLFAQIIPPLTFFAEVIGLDMTPEQETRMGIYITALQEITNP